MISTTPIRLAMLGMVDGNGHPYSWSAIFNGYEPEPMARCPYAGIPAYLDAEPKDTLQIPDARVTHIWCDDPADARLVAQASRVPTIVDRAEDVIGQVDAVIVATDRGDEHVERCQPFVDAGLPIFVDKPLVDNMPDLLQFRAWVAAGHPIATSSCMRYAREFTPYHLGGPAREGLGELRHISITTAKSWERYGIHALEAVYPILGPGFVTLRNTGTPERNVVHATHSAGVDVTLIASADMYGAFGCMTIAGTAGCAQLRFTDTFYAFKTQLQTYVEYLRTGQRPVPWQETDELMRLVIAGIRSRDARGDTVYLEDLA